MRLPKLIVHKSRSKNNCFGIGKDFSNTSKFHLSQVATFKANIFKANCLRVRLKPSFAVGVLMGTEPVGPITVATMPALPMFVVSGDVKSNCCTTVSGVMDMNWFSNSKAEGSKI